MDVARALEFLHLGCDPPMIHGDIKPSNILLDVECRGKISDFGLSRIKVEGEFGVDLFSQDLGKSQDLSGNLNAETPPIGTPVDFSKELAVNASLVDDEKANGKQWGKDWWWKQDGSGELCSKDYVMEWIGSQICPSNADWDDGTTKNNIHEKSEMENSSPIDKANDGTQSQVSGMENTDNINGVDINMKELKGKKKKKKNRKMQEWWKEENLAELSKKSSKLTNLQAEKDDDIAAEERRTKKKKEEERRRFKIWFPVVEEDDDIAAASTSQLSCHPAVNRVNKN